MFSKIFNHFLVSAAGILLCLFVWQTSVAFGDNSVKETFFQKDIRSLSSLHTLYYKFSRLHLPFQSAPTPDDRETPNENELEEDFDDEWNPLVCHSSSESIFNILFGGSSFAQITYSIQNRSTVPLFILYHSWKSYLS